MTESHRWHPENDPSIDWGELPDQLRRDIDLVDDPLARLERNEHSTRTAIVYSIAIPILTFIAAFAVALTSRAVGGPLCDAGVSNWLCSRAAEISFSVIPGIVALGGLLGAGWITYATWASGVRWRPWLASMWALVPFSLLWMTATGTIAILGQR